MLSELSAAVAGGVCADSLIGGELRDQAIAIARETATRLRDRDRIEEAARAAERQTGYPKSVHWHPAGIAQGFAGIALMHSYVARCYRTEDWAVSARNFLHLAASDAGGPIPPGVGLFSGLAGLAFVGRYLPDTVRDDGFVAAVERHLLPQAARMAQEFLNANAEVSPAAFDVISGMSGIAAYLLCRVEDPACLATLRAILNALTRMSEDVDGIPRWHTPAHLVMDETMKQHYPHGNLNCGLAHGAPGIVAAMALARQIGVEVDGMTDAARHIGAWLVANRCDDEWGVNWPSAVALQLCATSGRPRLEAIPASQSPFGACRAAWCYGSPGIARALWLTGRALDQSLFLDTAVEAMKAVYRRPVRQRGIDSATFCHGVAGLLQITVRFGRETGLPVFRDAACALVQQILSLYQPGSAFGFRNLEPGNRLVDQPGLLDGAPGVVLALLAAATDEPPAWDRLFLLS